MATLAVKAARARAPDVRLPVAAVIPRRQTKIKLDFKIIKGRSIKGDVLSGEFESSTKCEHRI